VANCAILQKSDSYLVEFFDFQAKHGKWYQTEEEVELRAGVFQEKHVFIEQYN